VPPPGAPKAGGTVVLLSDGDTTVGRSEDDAARRAAELGVPVSTIAFGTPDGTVTVGIQTVRVPVDAEALRRVAETTGGRAFEAATAEELRSVFEDLGAGVGVERVEREVTDLFIGAALAFAVAAAIGSLAWFSRLPWGGRGDALATSGKGAGRAARGVSQDRVRSADGRVGGVRPAPG
jgi:Ca-activated chloride channel family protein